MIFQISANQLLVVFFSLHLVGTTCPATGRKEAEPGARRTGDKRTKAELCWPTSLTAPHRWPESSGRALLVSIIDGAAVDIHNVPPMHGASTAGCGGPRKASSCSGCETIKLQIYTCVSSGNDPAGYNGDSGNIYAPMAAVFLDSEALKPSADCCLDIYTSA